MHAVSTDGDQKGSVVTYEQQAAARKAEPDASFEDIKEQISVIAHALHDAGRKAEYDSVVTKNWGAGMSVRDAGPSQLQVLEVILSDLKEIKL